MDHSPSPQSGAAPGARDTGDREGRVHHILSVLSQARAGTEGAAAATGRPPPRGAGWEIRSPAPGLSPGTPAAPGQGGAGGWAQPLRRGGTQAGPFDERVAVERVGDNLAELGSLHFSQFTSEFCALGKLLKC